MLDLSPATNWQKSLAAYAVMFLSYIILGVIIIAATLVINIVGAITLFGENVYAAIAALITSPLPVSAIITSAVSGNSLWLYLNLPWLAYVASSLILRLVARRMTLIGDENDA